MDNDPKDISVIKAVAGLYRCAHYRDFVLACIEDPSGSGRKHGSVQKVARALGCHPTFVSQVLHGKNDFSVEQAIAFAKSVALSDEQTHFFVLLVQRERSGNRATRKYFDQQIKDILRAREAMVNRLPELTSTALAETSPFLRDWVPQAIHQVLQLPLDPVAEAVAEVLEPPVSVVRRNLLLLEELGLVERQGTAKGVQWKVCESSVHLGNKSLLESRVSRLSSSL